MGREVKRIPITPETELAKVLSEADAAPVLLEKDGTLYSLNRVEKAQEEDIFAAYNAQAALAGIRAAAGSWSDIDPEAFKAYIHRARKEGTSPATRP